MQKVPLFGTGLVTLVVLVVLSGSATALGENGTGGVVQNFLNLTEKDCVELSLDMIRKGIQGGDIDRVMSAIGESILIEDAKSKNAHEIAVDLEAILANSSKRTTVAPAKAIMRHDSGTGGSFLADFDILSPKITVQGDSAFVECELVLWDAIPDAAGRTGSRTTEQLVLWSAAEGQPESVASRNPYRWRLVKCNRLFEFLTYYGSQSANKNSSEKGQK